MQLCNCATTPRACVCARRQRRPTRNFFLFLYYPTKKTQIVGQNKKIGVEKTRKSWFFWICEIEEKPNHLTKTWVTFISTFVFDVDLLHTRTRLVSSWHRRRMVILVLNSWMNMVILDPELDSVKLGGLDLVTKDLQTIDHKQSFDVIRWHTQLPRRRSTRK